MASQYFGFVRFCHAEPSEQGVSLKLPVSWRKVGNIRLLPGLFERVRSERSGAEGVGLGFRKQGAVAGQKAAGPRKLSMFCKRFRKQEYVAVKRDKIFPTDRPDGIVARCRQTKPVIGLFNKFHGKWKVLQVRRHCFCCRRVGAIVRDNYFIRQTRSERERLKAGS